MDPENSSGWGWGWGMFGPDIFRYQRISQRAVRISLEKQLDPRGPIASRGGSVPVFLRDHITTCDFPGGVRTPCPLPLSPPMTRYLSLVSGIAVIFWPQPVCSSLLHVCERLQLNISKL